jgi:hypothetical protein
VLNFLPRDNDLGAILCGMQRSAAMTRIALLIIRPAANHGQPSMGSSVSYSITPLLKQRLLP